MEIIPSVRTDLGINMSRASVTVNVALVKSPRKRRDAHLAEQVSFPSKFSYDAVFFNFAIKHLPFERSNSRLNVAAVIENDL